MPISLLSRLSPLLVVVAAFALFYEMREVEARQAEAEFLEEVETQAALFQRRLENHREAVAAVASFFEASQSVDRRAFNRFVARGLDRFPGIQALEWIPAVAADQRGTFERALRAQGQPEFAFRRWTEGGAWSAQTEDWGAEYFPVYYVEPLQGNERALGIDLFSHPVRRDAIERARDSGRPVASARIRLAQESEDQHGFLLFHPAYRHDPTGTVREFSGLALGVFRVRDLVQASVQGVPEGGVALRILDRSAEGAEQLLYQDPGYQDDGRGLDWEGRAEVGGRHWALEFRSTPAFDAERGLAASNIALAAGLILSALLGVVVMQTENRTRQIEREVEDRTSELTTSRNSLLAAGQHLEATQRRLEASNADLQQFAYVASHDLKAPLRTVGSFTSLLLEEIGETLTESGALYARHITGGVDRMNRLIDDLLDFARLNSEHEPFKEVDLSAVLDGCLATLAPRIAERSAEVVVHSLPKVHGDESQLEQLFQNLLGNSITYCDEEAPRVDVDASRGEEEWILSVRDNGIGITADDQSAVFDIFRRLHSASEYPGTGIGLAICRRVVTRHGGRIWVESTEGEGSTFRFTLPDEPEDCNEALAGEGAASEPLA